MGVGTDLWNRFEAMLVKQDYDGWVSLFAGDAVYIDPGGRHEGLEAIRAWCDEWGPAFSDVSIDTSLVVEQGDVVIAEYVYRATHTGPLTMPNGSVVPATGKTSDTPVVTILRVDDGKIVAGRDYFDSKMGLSAGT